MSAPSAVTNVVVVGVGGQGVVLASEIIALAAIRAGMDAKKSEVHGLAQRGGEVHSHVRFGARIYSPIVPDGEADAILAFEEMEGLRWVDYLKDDGMVIVNTQQIIPPIVYAGKQWTYPEGPLEATRAKCPNVIPVDGHGLAKSLGNPKLANTILLGVLSRFLHTISEAEFLETLRERVPPRTIDHNLQAFAHARRMPLDIPKALAARQAA